MMTADDLSRRFFLDVSASGHVEIRERGQRIRDGYLPVFTAKTHELAELLRVRHCRSDRWSGEYFLNERPAGLEDLEKVADLFRAAYQRHLAGAGE